MFLCGGQWSQTQRDNKQFLLVQTFAASIQLTRRNETLRRVVELRSKRAKKM